MWRSSAVTSRDNNCDGRNSIFMQSTRRVTLRRESPIRAPENVMTQQCNDRRKECDSIHTYIIYRKRETGKEGVEEREAMLI